MATAGRIVNLAFQRLTIVAVGDETPAEMHVAGLEELQMLIDQLPQEVVFWSKITPANAAIAWSIGTPSYVDIPANYWGSEVLSITDANGKPSPLKKMQPSEWQGKNLTDTGTPTAYYDQGGRWYLSPIPAADPGLTVGYVAKPDAVAEGATVDLPEHWSLALTWGLAAHMAMNYGKSPADYMPMWLDLKAKAIESTVQSGPIYITLDD